MFVAVVPGFVCSVRANVLASFKLLLICWFVGVDEGLQQSKLIDKQHVGLFHQFFALFLFQYVLDLDEREKIVHPGVLWIGMPPFCSGSFFSPTFVVLFPVIVCNFTSASSHKKTFLCSLASMSFVKSQCEKDSLDKKNFPRRSALKTVQLSEDIPVCWLSCAVNWLV